MDIFTDGSALANSKRSKAGWACYWPDLDILRSGSMIGTNNMAELRAIDYALWYTIEHLDPIKGLKIVIHSDSEYSINVITGKKRSHANLEQLAKIKGHIDKLKELGAELSFEHVLAHTGKTDDKSKYNDIVDKEARRQAGNAKRE